MIRPLALATGNLTVFTECEAQTIAGEKRSGNFKATGLEVVMRDFASGRVTRRARIKARAYTLAAGAFFSSGLLLRNRETPNREKIGAKVHLQPHAQIFALFDRPMTKPGKMKDGQYIPYNGVPSIYYDDLLLYSDHTSGGNPYGKDAQRGVVDERGRMFGGENVYLADSSLFPTASGINPSWTIMALSHRTSSYLANSLG